MLSAAVLEQEWLSIDTDEWTSVRRRRYLNISVFAKQTIVWNLGLVRITGSASSERLVELLEVRLKEFGVDLRKHVVAITTDGAPVAKKIATLAETLRQLCLAHGIHLAVCDVLYEKKDGNVREIADESSDSDTDEEEDAYDIEQHSEILDFSSQSIAAMVRKVRRLGVLFKQSTIYREKLQKYVQEKYGNVSVELQLLIDCKTRWSSLYFMLERFTKISDCVEKTLIDFGSHISISPFDKTVLASVAKALEPIMMTVKVLSQRDCNLLKARAALKLMMLQIWRQNNKFARRLVRRLRERIAERWEISAGVLYYLRHGSYIDSFPNFSAALNICEDDSDVDYFVDYIEDEMDMTEQELLNIFAIPSKHDIKRFIVTLLQRLCSPEVVAESDSYVPETSVSPTLATSLEKSFEDVLAEEVRKADTELVSTLPQESALAKIVANEMIVFEKNKTRGIYSDKIYNMLITVKPSSVESERAFSSAGLVCTKIRSRMNDDTLDHLCFLRAFFNNPAATDVPN